MDKTRCEWNYKQSDHHAAHAEKEPLRLTFSAQFNLFA